MPKFSLTPNKLVNYNQVFYKNQNPQKDYAELKTPQEIRFKQKKGNDNSIRNLSTSRFHGFRLSDNAFRTLRKRIGWLYYLAKPRYVKTYNGKEIFSFKCAFITLTIPSKQKECTKEFTELYLNQFLTEIRQRTGMRNYVWRLEFQKNGNVHYHLVTDTYLDFFFCKSIWNRILSKGGYISDFQSKFKGLTLSQYRQKVDSNHEKDFNIIAKQYAKGCSENWENPNSVDVKNVSNGKSISFYISKYFNKSDEGGTDRNELDTFDNSKNMRLWFCSRGLSKLDSVSDFCDAVDYNLYALFSHVKEKKKCFFKYCSVIYFELTQIKGKIRYFLDKLLRDYSRIQGYIPAT